MLGAGLALAVSGCGRVRPAPVTRAWETMGSVLTAAAWGPDSAAVDRALARAFEAARSDSAAADSVARALGRTVERLTGTALAPTGDSWRDLTARGVALDRAAPILRESGAVDSAVLDFGGLYLFYAGRGRAVGIPDPDDAFQPIATLRLPESPSPFLSLRTATPDLEVDAHPRARSATAVAASAAAAAVWSVALLELGCDRALAAAARAGVGVVCVDSARRVRWSPDLRGWIAEGTRGAAGREESAVPAPAPGPAPGRAAARSGSTRRWSGPDSSP